MAAANAPIIMREVLTLSRIGINPQFITFTHVTMESDKYICVRETAPQNRVVIVDMSMPAQPLRRPIIADSALMNPNSGILALRAQLQGTTQDHLQIFNMETKAKMKSYQMPEQVVFWKWISPKLLGLVAQTSVYHWSIEGDSEPVKMFERTSNLANNQIINYRCDPTKKWLILIGIAPGSPERPQLVKGNMQLFSVDQQRSQALEAHAAAFAQFEVPGNGNPSTLISFATKILNAGQVISMLHVIELGAQPGKPSFTQKQADIFFPPDFVDDFPVAMQISHKYSLIYVITKLGILFVYDLETATAVYRNRISPDPIFLTTEATSVGGFYAINRRGQVLLATVNDQTIVNFVSGPLNNLKLAENLAKRLPGAEKPKIQGHGFSTFMAGKVMERFDELFAQTKFKEAAELAAKSPQGILRTPDTVAKFQSVPVQAGQTPPLLQYFGTLLTSGKLNAFESLELSRLVVNQNKKNLLENWLAEYKLECSEELGDLVKTVDNDLALKIYIKARAAPKVVAAFTERREFDSQQEPMDSTLLIEEENLTLWKGKIGSKEKGGEWANKPNHWKSEVSGTCAESGRAKQKHYSPKANFCYSGPNDPKSESNTHGGKEEKRFNGVRKLSLEELRELTKKGLCFKCGEKWGEDHVCKFKDYQLVLQEVEE